MKTVSKQNQQELRINSEIKNVHECRITGDGIESKVMSFADALSYAESLEKDLIEINGKINPPIMRIDSYDKYMYRQKKNAKAAKQRVQQIKEIKLRVNIAENDMRVKARKAQEFIEDGDKVKVTLTMKGRELTRKEENKKCLFEFITMLEDFAVPTEMPKDEGNRTIVILKPKK